MIEISRKGMTRNGAPVHLGDFLGEYNDPDEPYQSPQVPIVLLGTTLVGRLVLRGGILEMLSMTLDGPRTWSGWSREAELAREATLRALMIRLFGAESVDLGWARIELQRFDGRSMPGIVVGPVR